MNLPYRGAMAQALDEIIDRDLRPHVPGAAVAVLHAGEPVFESSVGHADLGWHEPVTPTTVFGLGSVTEPITALTVLTLVRDGLLDLDAPITAYLPGYPPSGATIRPRHLLSHTSGLVNFVTRPGFRTNVMPLDHTDAGLIALFANEPLEFPTGSRYSYSNSGYMLLAMAIEAVTAGSYAEAVTERVFTPAGMTGVIVLDDRTIVPELACGYIPEQGGFVHTDHVSMTLGGAAGGIACSLRNMTRLSQALLDGTIVGRETLAHAQAPVTLTNGRAIGYGYGWVCGTYRDRPYVSHAGGIRGYSTAYVHLPDQDITVIVLTNLGGFDAYAVARSLVDEVAPAPRPSPAWISVPASHRAGSYREPLAEIRIHPDGDRLLVASGDHNGRMGAIAPDLYVAEADPEVILRFHDDETPPACTLYRPFTWTTGYLDGPRGN